jgi:hypothetical protein
MIITKNIKVKIRKDNILYFTKLNYNVKLKEIITIPTIDLQKNSNKKVKVQCDICGDIYILGYHKYNSNIKKYNIFSCKKCSSTKRKITNKELYGTEFPIQLTEFKEKREKNNFEKYGVKNTLEIKEIRDNIINTNIKKYGCENPQQNENIKDKTSKTNTEKYGFNTPLKNEKIKNKIKETNIKNYGSENIFASEKIKQHIKEINLINYGVEFNSQRDDVRKKIKIGKINYNIGNKKDIRYDYDKNVYFIICEKCKNEYEITPSILANRKAINTTLCTKCNPIGSFSNSGYEIQLQDFIKQNYENEILYNSRSIISPQELDIYIPELKLGIEFNGIYWHNELNKDKNYHLDKTEMCEKLGIQLIHVYEDDWIYKQDIIKSIILNKLGKTSNKIYARKCEIKEINNNKIVKEFLEKNHIQGFIGSKVKLGLYYENEIVSLMTLGNRRVAMGKKTTNEGEYELLRFCNKLNTNIIGGASRLFKYFIDNYKPQEITTYADRSISQGRLYETLGFNFIEKTKPNYYYIIDGIKHHRFNFRKDKLVKEGYDINKTEHEIMLERGICRIYDSGNLKFNYIK